MISSDDIIRRLQQAKERLKAGPGNPKVLAAASKELASISRVLDIAAEAAESLHLQS